jgi:hypothetical protein
MSQMGTLALSMASPSDGSVPITSFVLEDSEETIYTLGGIWTGGSLKGIVYNLFAKDAAYNGGTPIIMN